MSRNPRTALKPEKISYHLQPSEAPASEEIRVNGETISELDLAAISLVEEAASYFSDHPDDEDYKQDVLLLNEAAARLHEIVGTGVDESERANVGGALSEIDDDELKGLVVHRAKRRYIERSNAGSRDRYDNYVAVGHEVAQALADRLEHIEEAA